MPDRDRVVFRDGREMLARRIICEVYDMTGAAQRRRQEYVHSACGMQSGQLILNSDCTLRLQSTPSRVTSLLSREAFPESFQEFSTDASMIVSRGWPVLGPRQSKINNEVSLAQRELAVWPFDYTR